MVTFLMADPGFRQAVEGILRSNRLLTLVSPFIVWVLLSARGSFWPCLGLKAW